MTIFSYLGKEMAGEQKPPDVCFFMSRLGTGGIGKMRFNLAQELIRQGYKVEFVLGDSSGPYVSKVKSIAPVVDLHTSHGLLGVVPFAAYLLARRPKAIVCEKLRVNVVALRARRLVRAKSTIFASIHGVLSHKLYKQGLSDRKAKKKRLLIERWYRENDGFIAVSRGIKEDLVRRFGIPSEKVHVIYNPVVSPDIASLAESPPEHPWLLEKKLPVIIGVGRLAPEKGFDVLLRAFGEVLRSLKCRLLILGEGSERGRLEQLASHLGISQYVSMPGFVHNPYPYLKRADLFVLSSKWEGFGNVIVEAMACGTPVVATDCPVGPREILEGGRLGTLVPVGDHHALSQAILRSLNEPVSKDVLIHASRRYTVEEAARRYIDVLGLRS